MNRRILSLFFVVICITAFEACSSSKMKTEGAPEASTDSAASGADEVGSIPEDALLATETASEPSESVGAAAAEEETANAETEADPFADLSAEAATTAEPSADEPVPGITTDSYTVKKGDTLMKIAFTLYGDLGRWKDLYEWNRAELKSGSQLRVGMRLQYENSGAGFTQEKYANSYLIKKGDTLAGIADEVYGRKKKYKKLQNYNSQLIKNPNVIFAGFTLYYDITPKEMAEAEARRKERLAAVQEKTEITPDISSAIPSAINPSVPSAPIEAAPMAVVPLPSNTPPAPASVVPTPIPAQ